MKERIAIKTYENVVRMIQQQGTVRYRTEEFNDLDLVRLQYLPVEFGVTEISAVNKDGSRQCIYTATDKTANGIVSRRESSVPAPLNPWEIVGL